MSQLVKEQIILVPRIVYEKAKVLREHKMYQSAIDLINDNKIECFVYVEVKKKR